MKRQRFHRWLYAHLALSDVNVALLLWCAGALMRATMRVLYPFALLLGYEVRHSTFIFASFTFAQSVTSIFYAQISTLSWLFEDSAHLKMFS